jgi:hypothetical protein
MERSTIHQLVSDKNKTLEQIALRGAESIIEQIAKQQEVISTAQAKIAELRKELNELEVKQIDAKSILGE